MTTTYHLRLDCGSANVSQLGDIIQTGADLETLINEGYRLLEPELAAGDAGVRGFVVEDDEGEIVAQH
jgi:hypothetical protein